MLSHLLEQSRGFDAEKQDYSPAPANTHHFDDRCELELPKSLDDMLTGGDAQVLPMTEWAEKQVCQRLGAVCWPGSQRTLPTEYLLDRCDPWLRALNLNEWIDKAPPERQWFIRAYQGSCRAVLTDRFSGELVIKSNNLFIEYSLFMS